MSTTILLCNLSFIAGTLFGAVIALLGVRHGIKDAQHRQEELDRAKLEVITGMMVR